MLCWSQPTHIYLLIQWFKQKKKKKHTMQIAEQSILAPISAAIQFYSAQIPHQLVLFSSSGGWRWVGGVSGVVVKNTAWRLAFSFSLKVWLLLNWWRLFSFRLNLDREHRDIWTHKHAGWKSLDRYFYFWINFAYPWNDSEHSPLQHKVLVQYSPVPGSSLYIGDLRVDSLLIYLLKS